MCDCSTTTPSTTGHYENRTNLENVEVIKWIDSSYDVTTYSTDTYEYSEYVNVTTTVHHQAGHWEQQTTVTYQDQTNWVDTSHYETTTVMVTDYRWVDTSNGEVYDNEDSYGYWEEYTYPEEQTEWVEDGYWETTSVPVVTTNAVWVDDSYDEQVTTPVLQTGTRLIQTAHTTHVSDGHFDISWKTVAITEQVWVPDSTTQDPSTPPTTGTGPSGPVSTAEIMEVLRGYAAAGNREGYWNYLAAQGVDYAKLALGVVRDDSVNGYVANEYAHAMASLKGINLTESQWNQFGVNLMKEDLAYRENYAANPATQNLVLNLPVQDIFQYHSDQFTAIGLDATAWTAYLPLQPYLSAGDYQGAERVWSNMMDPNFFSAATTTAVDVIFRNTVNASDRAAWTARVGGSVLQFVEDPRQAYTDPDKIDGYYYDGQGGWYSITIGTEPGTGSPRTYASSDQANKLNATREFRLQNLKTYAQKDCCDTSASIQSR